MAKINGMPTSIRSGIPKLPDTPVGWKREKLSKYLFEIKRPISLEPEKSYRLVTVKRSRGGVEERSRLLGREIKTPSQFLIEAGDFLISKRQIVHGACGVVPVDLAGSIVSNEYTVIGTTGGIDMPFLQYLSESMYFQQTCFHSSIGVHVEKMIFNVERWLNWHFNIPPLSEQKKISEILGAWGQSIVAFEKLIVKSKKQKIGLMQSLLTGKKRLQKFKGGFRQLKISDFADIDLRSLGDKTPGVFKFRYITLSDVMPGQISKDLQIHTFSEAPSRARRIIRKGDILMATVRPNLQAFARVDEEYSECIASTGFSVLTPKQGFHGDYLYHYLFSTHITSQLNSIVLGSSYPAVNSSEIKDLEICCPSYEEQVAIAEVLNASEKAINNLTAQLNYLRDQKQSLIQQLHSGQRRVKVNEAAITNPATF